MGLSFQKGGGASTEHSNSHRPLSPIGGRKLWVVPAHKSECFRPNRFQTIQASLRSQPSDDIDTRGSAPTSGWNGTQSRATCPCQKTRVENLFQYSGSSGLIATYIYTRSPLSITLLCKGDDLLREREKEN